MTNNLLRATIHRTLLRAEVEGTPWQPKRSWFKRFLEWLRR